MGLMKKLTSALVASSLVFSLVGTAAAAYTPAAGETGAKRMQSLNLITGRDGGDLALNSEITRAELVTIIVRAFGKEADAKLLTGSTVFPDTANHWASGNIAMAVALANKAGSDPIGMPDGTFAPDAKLTPAQAVAFLMKFVGVKADASKSWPANYLDVAVEKNLISAEDKAIIAPMLNENATRGLVFYLFDRAFFGYKLPTGGTFYTTYVDNKAPELTVNAVDATTMDSKVTITGNVKDAAELYVGTTKVTADASGNFSADVALDELKDYDITVTALDLAGNKAEKALKVTRAAGTVASIEASDITVAAGGVVEVKAVAKDAKGNMIADAAVTGESTVGSYADGKFTANKTVGTGTLTLKAGEITKDVNVTVKAGALAKVVANKTSAAKGEKVTLTAQDENGNAIADGVTYTVDSADALVNNAGVFIGAASGVYTVTAKAGDATATLKVGVYGATTKLVVSAPTEMVANWDGSGATGKLYDATITAQDANGNVNAADSATTFNLTNTGLSFYAVDSNGDAVTTSTISSGTVTNGVLKLKVGVPASIPGRVVALTADTSVAGVTDGTQNVTTVFPVATSIDVTGVDANYATNSGLSDTLTVVVKDQTGTAMNRSGITTGGYTATVTVNGPATVNDSSKKTDSVTLTNGAGTFVLLNPQGATGDISVTATVDGLGTVTKTAKALIAGPATQLKVSAYKADGTTALTEAVTADNSTLATFVVKAVDAQGVTTTANLPTDSSGSVRYYVTFGGVDVTGLTFYEANGTTPIVYDSTNKRIEVQMSSGVATFKVKSSTFLGTLPINAAISGYTSASSTVSFNAGSASKFALAKYDGASNSATAPKVFLPVNNPTTSVNVQLTDSQGNAVAKSGAKLVVTAYEWTGSAYGSSASSAITLNGTAGSVTVTTDANGVATVNVEARKLVNKTYKLVVSDDPTDTTSYAAVTGKDVLTFNVTDRLVATATVEALFQSGSVGSYTYATANTVNPDLSAQDVAIKVTLKDQYGVAVSGQAAYLSLSIDKILWKTGTPGSLINNAETAGATYKFLEDGTTGTYWLVAAADSSFSSPALVKVAKAGFQTVTVKYSGNLDTVSGTTSLNVLTGAYAGISILDSGSAITSKSAAAGTIVGPLTAQLVDAFGNAVTSGNKTIKVSGPVRSSATSVDIASFNTNGSFQFYVAVATSGTVTLTDDKGTVTNTDDVTATLTITAQ